MSYLDTRMKDIYLGVDQSTPNIQHFGILGMKWGIRRYQNEDGTLTEEGKKRYRDAGIDFKRSNMNEFSKWHVNLDKSGFYKSAFQSDALIKNITKLKNEIRPSEARRYAKGLFNDNESEDIVKLFDLEYYPNYLSNYNFPNKVIPPNLLHVKYKQDIPFIRKKALRGKDGSKSYLDQTLFYWDFDDKGRDPEHSYNYSKWILDSIRNKDKKYFNKIYKKMGVDIKNEEDPDVFKKAEYDYYMKYLK